MQKKTKVSTLISFIHFLTWILSIWIYLLENHAYQIASIGKKRALWCAPAVAMPVTKLILNWKKNDELLIFVMNLYQIYIQLAYRPALCSFQLALRGYSDASLPRASCLHLAHFSHSLHSRAFRISLALLQWIMMDHNKKRVM